MRNRKTVVVAFLLVAVMMLGVGYAALTDVLDINGTVDVSASAAEEAFNEDIYFSAAVANQTGNVASVATGDPDMASFTIYTLKGKDDTATFTFTITNDGDLDAKVTPTLASDGNSNPTFFDISSDWAGAPKTIAAGSSETYTVTVKLLKTPTATDNTHGAFHIELTAVSVDPVVTP